MLEWLAATKLEHHCRGHADWRNPTDDDEYKEYVLLHWALDGFLHYRPDSRIDKITTESFLGL